MKSSVPCLLCNKARLQSIGTQMYECANCGAVQGTCTKGESYNFVKPWFVSDDVPQEDCRYYDMTVLGSNGIERRHGWFQVGTRLIVQVG